MSLLVCLLDKIISLGVFLQNRLDTDIEVNIHILLQVGKQVSESDKAKPGHLRAQIPHLGHQRQHDRVNIIDGQVFVVRAQSAYDIHRLALLLPVVLPDQVHGLLIRALRVLERLLDVLHLPRATC